jgi:uncharacterized phage protein gp47/JayE
MPIVRPSLTTLIARYETELAQRLGLSAILPRGFLAVFARVWAGAMHGLYGYADWVSKQAVPTTAESEALSEWAITFGVFRSPAGYAHGTVTLTGTAGSTVLGGTRMKRDDGTEYAVDIDSTFVSGTLDVAVTAVLAGPGPNCPAATEVTLSAPVSGVQADAVVATGGIIGGTDIETDDSLRSRLLFRLQNPPSGGSASDYVLWALAVPGVTRAWCLPEHYGVGTVGVTFAVDGEASPIPNGGKVAEVQAYIDARRPVQAAVTVFAPTPLAIDLTIDNLVPDTAAVRSAIEQSLTDAIIRDGEPGQPVLLSHLREAISLAPGEEDYTLTSPVADITVAAGELPVLGTVTWA